ncbi:DUF5615 family PIN-like protein [Romeria aff. gracilis LEGE 07310]|uniref:DUF5615 family PIN-like protein n=1 Tax=Vasconcelosia minhoensis LEGE 07310 TaxID=915328 RepID=A0A8J7ASM6_9CYAN|nr:DUF5615 family PIN-like protein [Romeria gracilis]MBE9080011.1 DUF5615 family PIN-like protein [Romeria aff. gracilis LEGE 07310]
MKLKLDENLGQRGFNLLQTAGHDVMTVSSQNLTSAADEELIQICQAEQRCLVTLDLDFSNPLRFDPKNYGIAVLRLPGKPSPQDLKDAMQTLIKGLTKEGIEGQLWIIQRGKIRIYQQNM